MRIKSIKSVESAKFLFKGQNKNNITQTNINQKEKTLMGQPIKRPLFK